MMKVIYFHEPIPYPSIYIWLTYMHKNKGITHSNSIIFGLKINILDQLQLKTCKTINGNDNPDNLIDNI